MVIHINEKLPFVRRVDIELNVTDTCHRYLRTWRFCFDECSCSLLTTTKKQLFFSQCFQKFITQFYKLVWSCLPFIRSGQNHPSRHSERGKKTRQAEEEVGRQHQGMDRPGARQVPESREEQGKVEEMIAKSSVVPQRPSLLRDR